jgi:hypothetical protein
MSTGESSPFHSPQLEWTFVAHRTLLMQGSPTRRCGFRKKQSHSRQTRPEHNSNLPTRWQRIKQWDETLVHYPSRSD